MGAHVEDLWDKLKISCAGLLAFDIRLSLEKFMGKSMGDLPRRF